MSNAAAHGAHQLQAMGLPHVIFELTDKAQDGIGQINDFVVKPISASEAFREYNWLAGAPVLNSSGNLRGMIVSKQLRTVYIISESAGEYLGLAAMLFEIAKQMSRMQQIWNSNMGADEKAPRLLLIGSSAILRSVVSVVPTAVHLVAKSLEGYCYIAALVSGSSKPVELANQLNSADVEINEIHQQLWDGENWYTVIVSTVNR
jgi:hypothetical protein